MSGVVSAELGFFTINRQKHIPIPVQYQKNDSGEPEPADFAVPPQLPFFNLSKKIRLPAENLGMPHIDYVPLKCDQYLSHPAGASLFNADTPAWTAPLDIESDVPYPVKSHTHIFDVKFPDVAPAYPYDQGIKGGSVAIKFDDVSEPTPIVFRKTYGKTHSYAPAHLNYDLGVDELRMMAKREHY